MIKKVIQRQKSFIGASITNRLGTSLKGKYLIIESDDWGAIRTPSKEVLGLFEKRGLNLANSVYKNDSLASEEDLEALFNVLLAFKDINGNHAKITANSIMANPDFAKIKESDYQQYFFEPFTTTLKRYPKHQQSFEKWKQGIEYGVFVPQFHGREHLNINRWLKVLQSGNENALFCFDQNATYSGEGDYSFMEAYDWDNPEDIENHKLIIKEGLEMFSKTFGFESKSFIAPCYNWDSGIEPTLFENGVRIVQGIRNQYAPTGSFDNYIKIRHFFGEKNGSGLMFNMRNAILEPSQYAGKDWVDSCMAQISSAFLFNKPAVISSHRINYIGFIDPKNREQGLKILHALLKKVMKKWPDVQFISTDQLLTVK